MIRRTTFRTASLLSLTVVVLAACPRDDKKEAAATVPVDSTLTAAVGTDTAPPADLSTLTSNIPEAAPDTFRRRTAAEIARSEGIASGDSRATSRLPDAPPALISAVEREQSFTRFCFQEFGQKADPGLTGGVSMVVSVGNAGITDAKVGNSRWSSSAGQAVNSCISQKAKLAWKLEPGAVKPGQYVVPLTFRGS